MAAALQLLLLMAAALHLLLLMAAALQLLLQWAVHKGLERAPSFELVSCHPAVESSALKGLASRRQPQGNRRATATNRRTNALYLGVYQDPKKPDLEGNVGDWLQQPISLITCTVVESFYVLRLRPHNPL